MVCIGEQSFWVAALGLRADAVLRRLDNVSRGHCPLICWCLTCLISVSELGWHSSVSHKTASFVLMQKENLCFMVETNLPLFEALLVDISAFDLPDLIWFIDWEKRKEFYTKSPGHHSFFSRLNSRLCTKHLHVRAMHTRAYVLNSKIIFGVRHSGHICDSATWEAESGGSRIQGPPEPQSDLEVSPTQT